MINLYFNENIYLLSISGNANVQQSRASKKNQKTAKSANNEDEDYQRTA